MQRVFVLVVGCECVAQDSDRLRMRCLLSKRLTAPPIHCNQHYFSHLNHLKGLRQKTQQKSFPLKTSTKKSKKFSDMYADIHYILQLLQSRL